MVPTCLSRHTVPSGEACLSGPPPRAAQVAFVPQEDALLSTLTVAECLTYSALLRLPRHVKPEQLQVCQGAALLLCCTVWGHVCSPGAGASRPPANALTPSSNHCLMPGHALLCCAAL